MNTTDLKKYLQIVIDMERELYMQKQLKAKLVQSLNALRVPQLILKKEPTDNNKRIRINFEDIVIQFVMGIFITGIVCLILYCGFFTLDMITSGGMPTRELNDWLGSLQGIKFILILLTGGGLLSEILLIYYSLHTSQQKRALYQEELRRFKQNAIEEKHRIQQETEKYTLLSLLYKREIKKIEEQINRSQKCLQRIYDANIIHPKYREFTRVCSLYEYIDTGRCWSLEKTATDEGAYNILEKELLANIIIAKLDYIVSNLDTIRNNQYELYISIKKSNGRLSEIVDANNRIVAHLELISNQSSNLESNLDKIQENSELTRYFSERSHIELSYMNRMNYYSGNYNGAGVHLRFPPT